MDPHPRGRLSFTAGEAIPLAAQGNVLPLVCELPGDLLTPVGAFLRLASDRPHAFLLESVEGGERIGRYSFLGCDPWALVRRDRLARAQKGPDGANGPADPFAELRRTAGAFRPVHLPDLPPFTGGVVGCLAYDAVRAIETIPDQTRDDLGFPDLDAAFYDTVVAFDRLRQRIQIVANLLPGREGRSVQQEYALARERIDSIVARLAGPLPEVRHREEIGGEDQGASCARGSPGVEEAGSWDGPSGPRTVSAKGEGARRPFSGGAGPCPSCSPARPASGDDTHVASGNEIAAGNADDVAVTLDRREFESRVQQAKEEIAKGEIFQVVLSRRLGRPFQGDPFSVYRILRAINPSPYNFYLRSAERALAGASPEMLVRVQEEHVEMRPIAGTRRRGGSEEEDARLETELRADPKEMAEHLMLVDLGRNDIGRVAAPGTVRVTRFAEIERYSHVMHLVSAVEGRLRSGSDSFDAFLACFPAGTVTGAPKVRAMEIIDGLEPTRRGAYAGAVFYRGFDGALDSAIAIRVVLIQRGRAYVQAGAGIVADSNPAVEFAETESKARAAMSALERAGEIL